MSLLVALLVAAVVGASVGALRALWRLPKRKPYGPVDDGEGPFLFPAGFLWGAATSDQQIEHQQPSDWTELEIRARAGDPSAHIAGIADVPTVVLAKKCDFDRLYVEDLRRAASMGHNAHRFSLSWSRLFPREDMDAPDPGALDFYSRVVDECARCGMVPFVTLHHFAIPAWLAQSSGGLRGLERHDAVARFEQYAAAAAAALGDRVRFWCTINEPMVVVVQGYLDGVFPPNEKRSGPPAVASVVTSLLRMNAVAYRALHADAARRGTVTSVGIAKHVRAFMPWRDASPLDRIAAAFADRAFVLEFLDALQTGVLRGVGVVEGVRGTMDYVGVNFYGRSYVKAHPTRPGKVDVRHRDPDEPGEEVSDLGWAADEASLTDTLVRFSERYARPLYVLENGLADNEDDDVRRQRFLVRHAQALWRAAEHHGVDVRGYFHWSLIDNFEWAEGFGPRFGLYAVDYEDDFARRPRASVEVYKQIASQNALSAELWRRHRR